MFNRDVLGVLRSLELTGPYPQEEYVRTMERRFGRTADRYMDAVDEAHALCDHSPAVWERLYKLKNANWEMSAYSTGHSCGALYRAFLDWLVEHLSETPRRVIDVGCEVGLLSLAIAKLLPETEVVGLDRVGPAIASAKELRKKFNSRNSHFRRVDLYQPLSPGLERADFLLCGWVFHESLPSVMTDEPLGKNERIFLENLASLSDPEAVLVSVNRFPDAAVQVERLSARLETVGFREVHSSSIEVATETFPLVCHQKS